MESSTDRCSLLLHGPISSIVSMRTTNRFVSVQRARASHMRRSTMSCLLLGKRMHCSSSLHLESDRVGTLFLGRMLYCRGTVFGLCSGTHSVSDMHTR